MNITTVVANNKLPVCEILPFVTAIATSIFLGPARSTAEFLAKLVLTVAISGLVETRCLV
jgi:hypothetical protein